MPKQKPDFERGVQYWSQQSADYNGVLGGYGNGTLPRIDALGARMFLLNLLPYLSTITPPHHDAASPPRHTTRVIDCGAGVGRVTSDTLLPLFDRVDLVEPVASFLDAAVKAAPSWRGIAEGKKGVRIWQSGLQDFDPGQPGSAYGDGKPFGAQDDWDASEGYDVVWIQWCIGHLSNAQVVAFLQRCRAVLRKDAMGNIAGLICVKENHTSGDADVFDKSDSSWTRSDKSFRALFTKAGLDVVRSESQLGFPEGLYGVRTCVVLIVQVHYARVQRHGHNRYALR